MDPLGSLMRWFVPTSRITDITNLTCNLVVTPFPQKSYMFILVLLVSAALLSLAAPTVKLDSAVVTGVTEGSIDKFLGIPFALPP